MATTIDGNGDVIYTDNESIAEECGIPVKKNMEHYYANKRRNEAKICAGIKEVDRDLDKALKQHRSESWIEKLKRLLRGK